MTTTASIDGRIALRPSEPLLDPAVWRQWEAAWPPDVAALDSERRRWIEEHHGPTVTLEGSGTFVATDARSPWAEDRSHDGPVLDHLPRRAGRWFVVVDGRGRVDWTYTGDDETALLVLVCATTPTGYLAHLRRLGVGYLVAGEQSVDLCVALERVHAVLGATAVVADGGGGLNGALLRSGLVDELHVVTFPALIGGATTPSFLDGPPLAAGESPVALTLRSVVRGDAGSTWTHYDVVRPA